MATVIPIAAPLVAFALFAASVGAQSACSTTLTPASSIQLSVASGYQAQVIATGLSKPRSLQFDKSGNLLVVEAGSGSISALTLQDNGGTCVSVRSSKKVVDNKNVRMRTVKTIKADSFCSSIMDSRFLKTGRPFLLQAPSLLGYEDRKY